MEIRPSNSRQSGHAKTILLWASLAAALVAGCSSDGDESSKPESTEVSLVEVEVTRGDLAESKDFNGTVTHGEKWNLVTTANGTVTFSQPKGTIVTFGEAVIAVDNQPIILAQGELPMYRKLYNAASAAAADAAAARAEADANPVLDENGAPVAQPTTTTKAPAPIEGEDVAQLQRFLIEQGFDLGGAMLTDGKFGSRTEQALKQWQKSRGLPETGTVDSAQIVFTPRQVRIEKPIRVGSIYEGIEVTPARPAIRVETTARERGLFKIDDEVQIVTEGEDRIEISGRVTKQESVTDEFNQSTSWQTTITPDDILPPNITAVKVIVTEVAATDTLLVPVSALIALAEGGWAVELSNGGTRKLVGVELDEVLESTAAISGDLEPGDLVLIPE